MNTPDLENGIAVTSTQEIGKILRDVRKAANIKQSTIAGLANWGGRFIGDVENGKATVQAQMLLDLIGWLGLEIVIRKKGFPSGKAKNDLHESAPRVAASTPNPRKSQ